MDMIDHDAYNVTCRKVCGRRWLYMTAQEWLDEPCHVYATALNIIIKRFDVSKKESRGNSLVFRRVRHLADGQWTRLNKQG